MSADYDDTDIFQRQGGLDPLSRVEQGSENLIVVDIPKRDLDELRMVSTCGDKLLKILVP